MKRGICYENEKQYIQNSDDSIDDVSDNGGYYVHQDTYTGHTGIRPSGRRDDIPVSAYTGMEIWSAGGSLWQYAG